MQLNSVTHTNFLAATSAQRAVARVSPLEREESPILDLGHRESLAATLKSVPDTRPELVIRARELYSNVPYPPTEIVNGISQLIAKYLPEA